MMKQQHRSRSSATFNPNAVFSNNEAQLQVMSAAIVGSGKTTLYKSLQYIVGSSCTIVCQDEVGGNNSAFLEYANRVANDKDCKLLLLDKNLFSKNHRKLFLKKFFNKQTIVCLEWYHPSGMKKWSQLSLERIIARGDNHPTLPGADRRKASQILAHFVSGFQQVDFNAEFGHLPNAYHIRVNVSLSPEAALKHVISILNSMGLLKLYVSPEMISQAVAYACDLQYTIRSVDSKPHDK